MTNIKTHGFGSNALLREHLEEIDDYEAPVGKAPVEELHISKDAEIALLRKEVDDLRDRTASIRSQTNDVGSAPVSDNHPWRRIIGTIAMTYLLGRVVQRLRLGAAGAVAVPLITAQVGQRYW